MKVFLSTISIVGAQILHHHRHLTNIVILITHPITILVRFLWWWKHLQNLCTKNLNGAQKNVHIFNNNAPTLLQLGVGFDHMYTNGWIFLIQQCDVLCKRQLVKVSSPKQGSVRPSFDFRDRVWDWTFQGLNFKTESNTKIFFSLSFETESETGISRVLVLRLGPRLKFPKS